MRKCLSGIFLIVFIATLAMGSRKDEVTLVMVPREDAAVRVGMDVVARYPTLLVSYKVEGDAISLHGWNGKEWVSISLDNFISGHFFRTGPDSALVVEAEGQPIPGNIIPPEEWCGSVYKITTTDLRPLVHLTGQYFDFKHKDWSWFSENYKMSMEAINPEGLNVAWYHKSLGGHFKKGPVAGDDLKFWVAVRHPEEAVQETALVIDPVETNVVEEAAVDAESDSELSDNPLTNDAPMAVVLGAGEAESE